MNGGEAATACPPTHGHLLAGSPAVEDFGLELGGERLHHLHLDQCVLLRTNTLSTAHTFIKSHNSRQ